MSNIAFSRIQRECKEVVGNREMEETGISIQLCNDSLTSIKGTITGPPDSPYQGGKFTLDIVIPETYPFQPPKVKFETKIWHPNISSQTGMICLDILKDQWAASLTLRTVLLSIQSLLALPEPKDPQETARFWTQHFASAEGPKKPEYVHMVNKLRDMGVGELRMPCDGSSKATEGVKADGEVKKLKPCCACPETKKPRDACIIEKGEEHCGHLIEAHKECMRKLGFNI